MTSIDVGTMRQPSMTEVIARDGSALSEELNALRTTLFPPAAQKVLRMPILETAPADIHEIPAQAELIEFIFFPALGASRVPCSRLEVVGLAHFKAPRNTKR